MAVEPSSAWRAAGMKKPTGSGGGARALTQRIKKKSSLKESSRRWLERHLNDPYVHRSKAEGYRSRAAYKLIEIDDRFHILKPGLKVLDLGAAPGGWCQVAAARIRSRDDAPSVVGIDYLPMDAIPAVALLEMDFLDDEAPARPRDAGRTARHRLVGHGGADHRPSPDRSSPHHASGRGRD